MNLDRTTLMLAIELITTHWSTTNHLPKISITEDALCPRCKSVEETSLYKLTDCKPLLELRKFIVEVDAGVNINIME